jgi:acetyl-CoA carboxylase carboxyl transferase subunit alpha
MAALRVPIVTVVIGEGGSGGALAISVADRILMLENAVYTVASPEACASILWRDPARAPEAATALRLTAADLAALGIVDEVIPEPVPAHDAPHETIQRVGTALARHLHDLCATWTTQGHDALLGQRYQKYRQLNYWEIQSPNVSQ